MKIEFVNHSSFVVRHNATALLCDFWKDGTAFDNGWRLLCNTKFQYEDFADITHIWFSHEHPDHFSPPNLKQIPVEYREKITILFQQTKDKRVVNFCRKLGFGAVVELPAFQLYRISSDLELLCAPHGASYADVDSWLCIKSPTHTILNVNDCELENDERLSKIRNACGKIDFLATQFSFASKQGDALDETWQSRARKYHLDKLRMKVEFFKPTYTLPFASFVFWCHAENRYLNDGMVKVREAVDAITASQSVPIVMYPGDEWEIGKPWANAVPLKRYDDRYDWLQSLPATEFATSESVPIAQLISEAEAFLRKMFLVERPRRILQYISLKHADISRSKFQSTVKFRIAALMSVLSGNYVRPLIYVEDHDQALEFSLANGLRPVPGSLQDCHLSIRSQALSFCLTTPYGGESVQVNGRFQRVTDSGWPYLRSFFFLSRRLDQAYRLPNFVLLDAILHALGM